MKLNAILIDDEPNNLDHLHFLLDKHCPDVQVAGTAQNVEDGLALIAASRPDLLFLDIQMPGKDGFDLLKALPDRELEVIFVTAYEQYGIQAVKFSAIDYLLKPIDTAELTEAVHKVSERVKNKRRNDQLENLLELIDKKTDKTSHRISLPMMRETRLVLTSDIIRCEAANNYTSFFLTTGETLIVSKPIYEYEELLADYGFLRCHQSHLVNSGHVLSLIKEDSGYLLLSRDHRVPVSRQRKDAVKKALGF